jgi:hypothetical protein
MHQETHGSDGYKPQHYCPGQTRTIDREIYKNGKRKNQGNDKYITIRTIDTLSDCGNCIQRSILAKLLSSQGATLSHRTIVTGSKIDFNKHCKLQFCTYIQMHEQHNNSLLPRMAGAIALSPTGNEQGSYYFLSLHTGKRVARIKWTAIPMPAEVIATVHQLAAACKKYKGITFTDKDGNIIRDGDDEDDMTGNTSDEPRDNSEITGVDEGENEIPQITGVPQINPEGNSHDLEGNSHDPEGNSHEN